MARILCSLAACALVACGSVKRPFDDANGGLIDARIDGGMVDAPPQPPPTPSREIITGGGRVTGPTYTLDVEVGQPIDQRPASGPTYTMEGNAAVKP